VKHCQQMRPLRAPTTPRPPARSDIACWTPWAGLKFAILGPGAGPPATSDESDRVKIYTRGGDAGETVLIGGVRVRKDDPQVAAYGAVDELNSAIGLAWALRGGSSADSRVAAIQEDLFTLGARLAAVDPARAREKGTIPVFDPERIEALERWIDEMDEDLAPLDAFVLPGGSPSAAAYHVARTVCRRAERAVVGLLDGQPDLAEVAVPYLNRLSDLLFTLARWTNREAGVPDTMWLPQRRREDAS